MILKMKSLLMTQFIIEMEIGLICAYLIFSFYNVENDEKIHLKNGETTKIKRSCYAMKGKEKVSLGKLNMANQ